MDYNPDRIYNLTLREIAGMISEEDKEYLYKVIADNEEAFLCWQDLHQTLGEKELQEAKEIAQRLSPKNLMAIAQKRRRIFMTKIISTAAVVVLVLGTAIFFAVNRYTFNKNASLPVTFNKKQPRLELATGKIIYLSGEKPVIQQGGVTLINDKDSIFSFSTAKQSAGLNKLYVPEGRDYNIMLADGSNLQLNGGTTIIFPFAFTGKTREIYIHGEAFMNIAKNEEKPFIVKLPGGIQVKVLGTSFNVNSYDPHSSKISLVTGALKVDLNNETVELSPGQTVETFQGKLTPVSSLDSLAVLGWRSGIYKFTNTVSLREVIPVMQRWYGITVKVDDSTHLQKLFGGYMDRNKPLDTFLNSIAEVCPTVHFYYDPENTLHLQ